MTKEEEVIEYFKSHRKIFCEDHLKICPKDSIAYQATFKEKEFYDMAIKVLEQQPSEDCVSREDVISVLNSHWLNGGCARRIIDEQIDEVKKLSSVTPTQKWIPCSERLPKPGEYVDDVVAKYYLVQNEYGDMLVARYTHSGYWEQIYRMEPIGDEVVAWMPLPKQYKAEMESNACKDCYYNDGEVHAECVVCGKAEMESE